MNDNFNNDNYLDDDYLDDFDMIDSDDSISNEINNSYNQNQMPQYTNYESQIKQEPINNYNQNTFDVPNYNSNANNNILNQQYNTSQNNNYSSDFLTSPLASMYEDKSTSSYEEELKTARPFASEVETPKIVEEAPKEVVYSNDFMNYDPMLHNGLETDGNYTITETKKEDDYVPEQTSFDSEGMMEFYKEENVEKEKPVEEKPKEEIKETFNTNGMMKDDEVKIDTFGGSEMQTQTSSRFINNDIRANENIVEDTNDEKKDIGSISVYNKENNKKEKTPTRKALEMVGTVLIFALLILAVSFFPDISKFFTNLRN